MAATLEPLNQARVCIRDLLQHNNIAECNNYIYMHHRGHHKQHILHMGLHFAALAADGYNHLQSAPGQVYA